MSKVPENRTNCFKMMSIGTALMALDREKGQISISTSDESLQQPPTQHPCASLVRTFVNITLLYLPLTTAVNIHLDAQRPKSFLLFEPTPASFLCPVNSVP